MSSQIKKFLDGEFSRIAKRKDGIRNRGITGRRSRIGPAMHNFPPLSEH
ncbi:hypothetical protein [Paenibacillus dendrobii]